MKGGSENDDMRGADGDDDLRGNQGNDDMHGGHGNDYMVGAGGDDDMYGGYGDDYMKAGGGDDDLWGGPGNDTMIGQNPSGPLKQKVLRGGPGDDSMFGGGNRNGGPNGQANGIWMYGDEGEDVMYGKKNALKHFMWGGEGNDYMRGGNDAGESKINGNGGSDIIHPGSDATVSVDVRGGKGDDIINPTVWDGTEFKTLDAQGELIDQDNGASGNNDEFLYGDEGDDTIWAGRDIVDEIIVMGGSGNDNVYGAYNIQTTGAPEYYYGNAGRDLIRTDWYQDKDPAAIDRMGNEYIYGDFKYGPETRDSEVWGDADIIIGGRGVGVTAGTQNIHGGDGDDQIYMGDAWRTINVYGENDNDTINIGEGARDIYIEAGEGNDTVTSIPTEDVITRARSEFIRGQGGNDRING